MELSPRISPLPPALKSQDFAFLREEGLSVIRELAATSWTDHNLHDPGITLLEAACYAVTEAGLRAGMAVEDLLASSGAERRPELFTAPDVLPSAPVTSIDLRKVLVDHPLVNNAWLFPYGPEPKGRFSALLEFADDALNSNVVTAAVTPPGLGPYRIALAFPHWDDVDVLPFREDVTLQAVSLGGPPGSAWTAIEGSTSFFTRATVTYQPPGGGSQTQDLWIVLRILSDVADPATELAPVLQAVAAAINDLGPTGPLQRLNERVTRAFQTMRVVRRYASTYRSLCEDVAEFNAVRLQEVAVSAIVEVGSGVALEELLAEMYFRIYRHISPAVRFRRPEALLAQAGTADAVFDGPLTESGLLTEADLSAQQIAHTIYTSDLLRLIYQLRTETAGDVVQREDVEARRIVAVRSLTLSNYIDNRPITTGARDCLHLVESRRHVPRLSVAKSRIVIYRNGVEVPYDADRVLALFELKLSADAPGGPRRRASLPVPAGTAYPVGEYYPIQNDLPVVYGVGEAGLPDHASTERRAQARQLKGFLMLFEQMVGGFQAQLAHFNTFFSADPDVRQTVFQQPLYHLPGIAPLLKAFDAGATTWETFQADDANGYARVLTEAVESRQQFLERRNVVLDHLLASLGEDMQDRAALLFRLAAQVPGAAAMTLQELVEARRVRRLKALRDLIRDKSAYYYDVPALDRDRGQAFGHPFRRRPDLVAVASTPAGFEWVVTDVSGTPLFRQAAASPSAVEARRAAEQVVQLATVAGNYSVAVDGGGQRRLEVRSHAAAAQALAESVDTYATDPDAQNALVAAVEAVLDVWTAAALIPLEHRLYHLLGIDVHERRQVVHAAADYVEVFDPPPPNPNHEKRFRLWERAGHAGDPLLESTDEYTGTTDPEAVQNALADVARMFEHGIDADAYEVEPAGSNTFVVVLMLPDATPLARSPSTFSTVEEAEAGAARIRDHLYRRFSGQGCYVLEHHLLFPASGAGTELAVPEHDDPYSFQLSVVLPSGYARDFAAAGSARQPEQPALYRNVEFRKYAEQQVRKYCPAHILPRVFWLDRAEPGTAVGAGDASFDAFEQAYRPWLRTYLADEPDGATLEARRDALATVMNAVFAEHLAD